MRRNVRLERRINMWHRNNCAAPRCNDNDLRYLVSIGYAEQGEITQSYIMYHVKREGMNFVERVTGIKILEAG